MAGFSYTVTVPRPPEAVFPWLFEADKAPQWTGNLEAYEVVGGPLGTGSKVRQQLRVSGELIRFELEITRYDPPRSAESRFSISGIEVVTSYALAPDGSGTRLTQTIEGRASGFKARVLVPIVQPRLERKLTEDLERLRGILSAA
jgi:uncharacterized protein YndB with AHSA1/START domain